MPGAVRPEHPAWRRFLFAVQMVASSLTTRRPRGGNRYEEASLFTWLVKMEMLMQMRSSTEVAQILAEDIERALGRYRAVKRDCAKSGHDASSRHRDRQPRVPITATRERVAILALSETLQRYGEFVLGGRIPEDLQR
jgi:hypothetical protein